jgi:hypothetical protein
MLRGYGLFAIILWCRICYISDSQITGTSKKTSHLPGEPKNKPSLGGLDVAFDVAFTFSLVIGEAMKFEGPTITGFGGELIVLLFTTGAFVGCWFGGGDGDDVFTTGAFGGGDGDCGDDVDWPKDGDCGDDGDDVEGGDSDDVSWPVDGLYGLYCATAILIELVIATILIAIIEDIKMTSIDFWLIKII